MGIIVKKSIAEVVDASKFECSEADCENMAVAWWPVNDPENPAHPYCKQCLNAAEYLEAWWFQNNFYE